MYKDGTRGNLLKSKPVPTHWAEYLYNDHSRKWQTNGASLLPKYVKPQLTEDCKSPEGLGTKGMRLKSVPLNVASTSPFAHSSSCG